MIWLDLCRLHRLWSWRSLLRKTLWSHSKMTVSYSLAHSSSEVIKVLHCFIKKIWCKNTNVLVVIKICKWLSPVKWKHNVALREYLNECLSYCISLSVHCLWKQPSSPCFIILLLFITTQQNTTLSTQVFINLWAVWRNSELQIYLLSWWVMTASF